MGWRAARQYAATTGVAHRARHHQPARRRLHARALADTSIDKLFEQTVETPKKQAGMSVREPRAERGEIPAFPELTNRSESEEGDSEANEKRIEIDNSFIFTCISCRFYSSGAQVKGLGAPCKSATITGHRNWRKISAGKHPDKGGVVVEINYSLNITA